MHADTFPPIHPAKLPINFSTLFFCFHDIFAFFASRVPIWNACYVERQLLKDYTHRSLNWNAAKQFRKFFFSFFFSSLSFAFRCDNSVLSVNLDLLWMKRALNWAEIGQHKILCLLVWAQRGWNISEYPSERDTREAKNKQKIFLIADRVESYDRILWLMRGVQLKDPLWTLIDLHFSVYFHFLAWVARPHRLNWFNLIAVHAECSTYDDSTFWIWNSLISFLALVGCSLDCKINNTEKTRIFDVWMNAISLTLSSRVSSRKMLGLSWMRVGASLGKIYEKYPIWILSVLLVGWGSLFRTENIWILISDSDSKMPTAYYDSFMHENEKLSSLVVN